jgi:beta-glucosidase-like glycosyl hydrolase
MGFAALFQAVAALMAPPTAPQLPPLTPAQKAALVVVSGFPAPRGVAGVIVRAGDRGRIPRGMLVFADQEGGAASAFADLPPGKSAAAFGSKREAFLAGRATGRALQKAGVQVDLAPVLDRAGGPLGLRHFRRVSFAVSFARGLAAGRAIACVKHFPGLGSAPISTDESPHVHARLSAGELQAFSDAIRVGVPCVMVGHAFYGRFGGRRASFSRAAYGLLRKSGFEGVAITDSVSVFGSPEAVPSALKAARAGADLVLFTNGRDAARAIRALLPLARRGLLDEHVRRVLVLRHSAGLAKP